MFWLDNPKILIESDNIFPSKDMNYQEKLNSIARFSLLFLIIIYLLNGNMKWMSFTITLIFLTIILNNNEEKLTNLNCTEITEDNPFGNFTINDYINNPERTAVCKTNIEENKKKLKDGFSDNVLLNEDYFQKQINFRDFYTLPVTTILNDQNGFAKSLLGSESGDCKTNGNNCLKNEDVKFHRGRYFNGDR